MAKALAQIQGFLRDDVPLILKYNPSALRYDIQQIDQAVFIRYGSIDDDPILFKPTGRQISLDKLVEVGSEIVFSHKLDRNIFSKLLKTNNYAFNIDRMNHLSVYLGGLIIAASEEYKADAVQFGTLVNKTVLSPSVSSLGSNAFINPEYFTVMRILKYK